MEPILQTTLEEAFPESLSELLVPTDPMLAREMASYHANALLRCALHATAHDPATQTLDAIAEHLASIEAILLA